MRKQRHAATNRRLGRAVVGGAILVLTLGVLGCDSSIDIRGPIVPPTPGPTPGPSGSLVTEPRDISGVTGVSLAAVGLVEIGLGASETLTITAPENVMPLLSSDVIAGLLVLDRDSESYQGQVSDIHYELALRQLGELYLRGVGEIRADGIDEDQFTVDHSGVGDIRASGQVDRQEVSVSGVGGYYATGLRSRVARVEITGGTARIWATDLIEGFVGAGCVLEYFGSPSLDIQGGGTVRQLDSGR